jgi:hypothetical protein
VPEVAIELEGENGCLPFLMQRIAEQGHAVVVVAEGIHSMLSCFFSFLFSFFFYLSYVFFITPLILCTCFRDHPPHTNVLVFILIFTLIFVLYL